MFGDWLGDSGEDTEEDYGNGGIGKREWAQLVETEVRREGDRTIRPRTTII